MLFEYMVDNHNIDIESDDVRLINDLILGQSMGYEGKESKYYTKTQII